MKRKPWNLRVFIKKNEFNVISDHVFFYSFCFEFFSNLIFLCFRNVLSPKKNYLLPTFFLFYCIIEFLLKSFVLGIWTEADVRWGRKVWKVIELREKGSWRFENYFCNNKSLLFEEGLVMSLWNALKRIFSDPIIRRLKIFDFHFSQSISISLIFEALTSL